MSGLAEWKRTMNKTIQNSSSITAQLLHPGECCVGCYTHSTDVTKVTTMVKVCPLWPTTSPPRVRLALVVNHEAATDDNGTQLMHDV